MKKLSLLLFLSAVLAACVTINVYFPAAEAERAAQEFIDKVIGEETVTPRCAAPPIDAPSLGNGVPS